MERVLSQQLVFSCEAGSFLVYDSAEARSFLRHGAGRPLLMLRAGPGNIFESAPKRVVSQTTTSISVQCADGSVVHLDFDQETAKKETPQGTFRYCGDLEDGNAGQGYMRA
jgi:hypothetical protein